ncbi:hypothetical protein D3C81_2070280 [compost metagenome]
MLVSCGVVEAAGVAGVLAAPVAAAVVELHDLLEGGAAAIVEVGACQGDVAQGRGLEGAIDRIAKADLRLERSVARDAGIERRLEGADVHFERVGRGVAL